MKPEYKDYKEALVQEAVSKYVYPPDNIAYMLKGKCYSWTNKFVEKFPTLNTGLWLLWS